MARWRRSAWWWIGIVALGACSSDDPSMHGAPSAAGTGGDEGSGVAGSAGGHPVAGGAGGSTIAGGGGSGAEPAGSGGKGGDGGQGLTPVRCDDHSTRECQPELLAPAQGVGGVGLTVFEDDVYWFAPGPSPHVFRTSLTEGTTEDLALPDDPTARSCLVDARAITNDAQDVYLLCGEYVVRYQPGQPGTWSAHDLLLDNLELRDFTAVGDALYVMYLEGLVEYSLPELTHTDGWYGVKPQSIASDGAQLFVTIYDDSAQGTAISKVEGGALERLGPPLPPPADAQTLAVDATTAYAASDTRIVSIPVAGADRETVLVEDAPNHPARFAVDDHALYFLDEDGLHAVELTTGTRSQLAAFSTRDTDDIERSVALSEDFVLWVSSKGLWRIRK